MNMQVSLISHTPNPELLLQFTKETRLNMSPELIEQIINRTDDEVAEALLYIANTIRSTHEFVDYVFLIEGVSRAFTHQFVRSRHASFAQQSMRVVNVKDGFDFVMPDRFEEPGNEHLLEIAMSAVKNVAQAYRMLVEAGAATEDARSILPTNIATNIVAKFNLRALADLITSRAGGRTQTEYRMVVEKMADLVITVHPWAEKFIFRDFGRDYFDELEQFAEEQFGGDLITKGKLLKIVDHMRGVK